MLPINLVVMSMKFKHYVICPTDYSKYLYQVKYAKGLFDEIAKFLEFQLQNNINWKSKKNDNKNSIKDDQMNE